MVAAILAVGQDNEVGQLCLPETVDPRFERIQPYLQVYLLTALVFAPGEKAV